MFSGRASPVRGSFFPLLGGFLCSQGFYAVVPQANRRNGLFLFDVCKQQGHDGWPLPVHEDVWILLFR